MAEEKVPRHKKMYKDSPKIERTADGKMGISRPQKDAAQDASGTKGMPETDKPDTAIMEMSQRHAKERLDLHHKHEKEHLATAQKAMKDGASMDAAGAESEGSGDGKDKISKMEKE